MGLEPHDVLYFATPEEFGAWLETHHAERDVQWVGFWRKDSGRPSLTWPESVDEALCWGWIDGLRKRIDDEAYTIRFTPRRAGSNWSLRNLERYAALDAEGRIRPPGRSAYARRVEERSGVYSFEQERALELSAEFAARLRADAAAHAYWQASPPSYRRTAAFWVMSAKRPATRERRFVQLLEDAAASLRVKPLRPRDTGGKGGGSR